MLRNITKWEEDLWEVGGMVLHQAGAVVWLSSQQYARFCPGEMLLSFVS